MFLWSAPKDPTAPSHYSSVYFYHQCPGYVHPTDETHGFFSSIALENRLLHSRLLYLWTLLSLLKPFSPFWMTYQHHFLQFSTKINFLGLWSFSLISFVSSHLGPHFSSNAESLKAQLKALQTQTLVWGLFLVLCRLHSLILTPLRLSLACWDSCAVFVIHIMVLM